ncbi:thioredoxin-like protein [Hysterangium stoloniferum]|nr:thioredoxin-like protein [Hysterangium stoloniferum]
MPNDEPEDLLRPPTPPVNPKVASLAARLSARVSDDDTDNSDLEDNDLFEELDRELEDGLDLGGFREKRMQELKQEVSKVRDMRENDHGKYSEITNEKEVIKICANEARCVVHFYHRNFLRCRIMDKHIEEIAPKYFSTRFIRVFVENVPWLVDKLAIKVLPCVICFVKGESTDRLIGFEELGNEDAFRTATLEMRLSLSGVLEKPKDATITYNLSQKSAIRGRDDENQDPFDLDD